MLVPAGRAADLIGRRAAFLTGMIVFAAASAACAAAPDVWVLVGARAVQAVGGALLIPASLSLLLAAAPPERGTGAIRPWTSVGGAAAALGPVLGGALVAASWHWVFLVNVPVVAIALIFGVRVLAPDRAAANAAGQPAGQPAADEIRPDALGAGVFTVAIGALALALVKADDWGWASPQVLGGFAAAPALIALFVYRSARHPSPVIELHLLRRPMFATATAANVVFGIAFGAMLLLVTLWCQDVWGWSALRTGPGAVPAYQRATVVLAGAAATAGPVSLLLVWAVKRDRALRASVAAHG